MVHCLFPVQTCTMEPTYTFPSTGFIVGEAFSPSMSERECARSVSTEIMRYSWERGGLFNIPYSARKVNISVDNPPPEGRI